MLVRSEFRKLPTVIIVFFALTATNFAQGAACDLRLNVFLLQKSDYPQNTLLKNARATAVNLDTNATLTSRSAEGVPYFAKLFEGKYNLLIGKNGFGNTVKQISLDCKFTDENNVFNEIIFLTDDKKDTNYRMWQIDYKIAGQAPSPALPSSNSKSKSLPPIIADDIALNERAVYLPLPIFTAEIERVKTKLISELTSFVVPVNIEIDAKGNVCAADADSDFKELVPAIVESAKKAKFTPFKVNGKPTALRGRLIYSFSKFDR